MIFVRLSVCLSVHLGRAFIVTIQGTVSQIYIYGWIAQCSGQPDTKAFPPLPAVFFQFHLEEKRDMDVQTTRRLKMLIMTRSSATAEINTVYSTCRLETTTVAWPGFGARGSRDWDAEVVNWTNNGAIGWRLPGRLGIEGSMVSCHKKKTILTILVLHGRDKTPVFCDFTNRKSVSTVIEHTSTCRLLLARPYFS